MTYARVRTSSQDGKGKILDVVAGGTEPIYHGPVNRLQGRDNSVRTHFRVGRHKNVVQILMEKFKLGISDALEVDVLEQRNEKRDLVSRHVRASLTPLITVAQPEGVNGLDAEEMVPIVETTEKVIYPL